MKARAMALLVNQDGVGENGRPAFTVGNLVVNLNILPTDGLFAKSAHLVVSIPHPFPVGLGKHSVGILENQALPKQPGHVRVIYLMAALDGVGLSERLLAIW